MKLTLPTVLSFNGGYVDTAGYLALQGLFTAHVTGNFVTIGAALVFGTSGIVAKLLALPVFCIIIIITRSHQFQPSGARLAGSRNDVDPQAASPGRGRSARDQAGTILERRRVASDFDRDDPRVCDGRAECGAPNSFGQHAANNADDGNYHPADD